MIAALLAAAILHSAPPHVIREYTLPIGVYPLSIVTGSDGALWFTTYPYVSNHVPRETGIGRITTSGNVTFYPVGFGITAGPDGNIWFTEIQVQTDVAKIGVLAP